MAERYYREKTTRTQRGPTWVRHAEAWFEDELLVG
jgi:hypothetical protein